MADVVARDHQVSSIITLPSHGNVHVWMFRVPVIDRGPVEFRAEVPLHFAHQIAGEGAQVGHLDRVIGRNDEPEMMSVTLAPFRKCARITVLSITSEHARGLAFFGDAFASQTGKMRRERR